VLKIVARDLSEKVDADFLGIEAGVMRTITGAYVISVACIYDGDREYYGISSGFCLPDD
jgi:non-canonical (house-cleaning) NTP pyrophosphatase